MRPLSALVLAALLAAPAVFGPTEGSPLGDALGTVRSLAGLPCIPHPRIHILDDLMLRLGPVVGVVNPEAAGTATDPFVIEGWQIADLVLDEPRPDTETGLGAIAIENTRAHIVVRGNCILRHHEPPPWLPGGLPDPVPPVPESPFPWAAVHLRNVADVTVERNTFTDDFEAFAAEDSRDIVVQDNTFTEGSAAMRFHNVTGARASENQVDDFWTAFEVARGTDLVAEGNVLRRVGDGLRAANAGDLRFERNTLEQVNTVAHIFSAGDVVVRDNALTAACRIEVHDAASAIIQGHTLSQCAVGILVRNTPALVAGNVLRNTTSSAITATGASGARIVGNTVLGGRSIGILLVFADGALVADNDVRETLGDGIVVALSNRTALTGNRVSATARHGFSLDQVADATVEGGSISDVAWNGILLALSRGGTVAGVEFSGGSYGIYDSGPRDLRVESSTFTGMRTTAIELGQIFGSVEVVGSTFLDVPGYGIHHDRSFSGAVRLAGNQARNVTNPVFIDEATSVVMEDNVISGFATGVQVSDTAQVLFRRNDLADGKSEGARFERVTSLRAEDNAVVRSYYGLSVVQSYGSAELHRNRVEANKGGIYLYSSANIRVENNTALNNTSDGILILGLSAPGATVLRNNSASGNGQYGISLNGARGSLVQHNTFAGNAAGGVFLGTSADSRVEDNAVTGAGLWGVVVAQSSRSTVAANVVRGATYAGLDLATSGLLSVHSNAVTGNGIGIELYQVGSSTVWNNRFANTQNYDVFHASPGNTWNITKTDGIAAGWGPDILGGRFWGGNSWSDYAGADTDGDGIGDTQRPYKSTDAGRPGDALPLV